MPSFTPAPNCPWPLKAGVASALTCTLLILTSSSYALTCPTKLKKTTQNVWHSVNAYPAFKNTAKNAKLKVLGKKFGAAVYNLKTKRMACSYKTNSTKTQWFALKSNTNNRIQPDLHALDRHTLNPLWKYSRPHHDYSCTASLQQCVYNNEEVSNH